MFAWCARDFSAEYYGNRPVWPFELDPRSGELRRDGTVLKLQPQPSRVLVYLVRNAGQIVTRQQLALEVWGADTFVDFEQGLQTMKADPTYDHVRGDPRFQQLLARIDL